MGKNRLQALDIGGGWLIAISDAVSHAVRTFALM